MKLFAKIYKVFSPLTIFVKSSIIDRALEGHYLDGSDEDVNI